MFWWINICLFVYLFYCGHVKKKELLLLLLWKPVGVFISRTSCKVDKNTGKSASAGPILAPGPYVGHPCAHLILYTDRTLLKGTSEEPFGGFEPPTFRSWGKDSTYRAISALTHLRKLLLWVDLPYNVQRHHQVSMWTRSMLWFMVGVGGGISGHEDTSTQS